MFDFLSKAVVVALCVVVFALIGTLIYCHFWVTSIDKHELGFTFDRYSGKVEKIERTGWVTYSPFQYAVHKIDLRPYQLAINANERVLNAKLVQFNPVGLDAFIAWHGREAGDSEHRLREIMKSYAFDRDNGADCPFITIVSELAPNQAGVVVNKEVGK